MFHVQITWNVSTNSSSCISKTTEVGVPASQKKDLVRENEVDCFSGIVVAFSGPE